MKTFWKVTAVLVLIVAAVVSELYWWNITGWRNENAPIVPVAPSIVVPPVAVEQPKENTEVLPLPPKTKIKG